MKVVKDIKYVVALMRFGKRLLKRESGELEYDIDGA